MVDRLKRAWLAAIARLPAGSVAALLVWELRIALRPAAQNQKVFGELSSVIKVAVLWQLLVGAPVLLLYFTPLPSEVFVERATSFTEAMLLLLPLGSVLAAAQALLRAEQWQLYLSAPIPWPRVVLLRCLQAVLTMWLVTGAVMPFAVANALIVLGFSEGLALYLMSLALHLAGGAFGLLVVASAVRAFGPQHARKVLIGFGLAFSLLCAALPLLLRPAPKPDDASGGVFPDAAPTSGAAASSQGLVEIVADSAFGEWIAAGLMGQWLPTLSCLIVAAALFWLACRAVGPAAQALAAPPSIRFAASDSKAGAARGFVVTPLSAMALKEWRIVLRSPMEWLGLLANMILIIGMLRLLLADAPQAAVLSTNIVAIAAMLTIRLMPVFIGAEEAATLLASAPVHRSRLLALKVAAALLPLFALLVLSVLVVAWRVGLSAAAITALFASVAMASVAAVNVCRPYVVSRKSFQQTGWPQGLNAADILAQMVLQFGWPLLAWAALSGYYWASLFGAGLLLVPLWSYWQDRQSETVLGY